MSLMQLKKGFGPNMVDRRVCGRITQIRSYLWHDSIRQLLLKILYNSWLCLLLVALGSIPKLCQHMYWVGGVRKMAIFAYVQYYIHMYANIRWDGWVGEKKSKNVLKYNRNVCFSCLISSCTVDRMSSCHFFRI